MHVLGDTIQPLIGLSSNPTQFTHHTYMYVSEPKSWTGNKVGIFSIEVSLYEKSSGYNSDDLTQPPHSEAHL